MSGPFINPSIFASLRRRDYPRMPDDTRATIRPNYGAIPEEDPIAAARRLLDAETPDAETPSDYDLPRHLPRMGDGLIPRPQQVSGDRKSRLLHGAQGALMGVANARRNPTNPNDWGAVVGAAIGGGAGGAINPQGIENEKYYERDLPRWYEQQKMQAELANRDRMQRMSDAQIANIQEDNRRADAEFNWKQTEAAQKAQDRKFENWDFYGDPNKPLDAVSAAAIGHPELVGQKPSGGRRSKGQAAPPVINTDEGIFERMPDGSLKPAMSPDTRTQPVRSTAFSGITVGEAPHQLQPWVAPKTPPAPHFSQDGRQMWNGSRWVPAPGYTEKPEPSETPAQRRVRERQDRQDRQDASGFVKAVQDADKVVNDAQSRVTRLRNAQSADTNHTDEYTNAQGHKVSLAAELKAAEDALELAHNQRAAAQQRAEESGLVRLDPADPKDTGQSKKRNAHVMTRTVPAPSGNSRPSRPAKDPLGLFN